jgi:hypothetical protein
MRIDDLIEQLQTLRVVHGNCEVYIHEFDECEQLVIRDVEKVWVDSTGDLCLGRNEV